jgi:DNA repair exonuclease SbcCD ATPase subunit
MTLICAQCGKEFVFSEDEQEFYKLKGYTPPHRCKDCRSIRRQQQSSTCSNCGNKFVEDSPIYCAACMVNVRIECDLITRGLQNSLDQANARLNDIEAEKSKLVSETAANLMALKNENKQTREEANAEKNRFQEQVRQKDALIADLEKRLQQASAELKNISGLQSNLDWLEPALTGIKAKLDSLERNQNSIREAVLNLEEAHKNSGLLEAVRNLFRPRRGSTIVNG